MTLDNIITQLIENELSFEIRKEAFSGAEFDPIYGDTPPLYFFEIIERPSFLSSNEKINRKFCRFAHTKMESLIKIITPQLGRILHRFEDNSFDNSYGKFFKGNNFDKFCSKCFEEIDIDYDLNALSRLTTYRMMKRVEYPIYSKFINVSADFLWILSKEWGLK